MSAPFTVTAWAARLKHMPIWAFRGAKDSLVPIGGSEELIDALRSLARKFHHGSKKVAKSFS